MKEQKLQLIDDLTSPLFRIMSIHNDNEPSKRKYDNNICAFHIGNGYILSVAHALKADLTIIRSITESVFQSDIFIHLTTSEQALFSNWYPLDSSSNKRYLNITEPEVSHLTGILKRINYDTRYDALYEKKICKPYLIIQQKADQFYNNATADSMFASSFKVKDTICNRNNYLIETELVEAFTQEDVALYKIINTPQAVIDLIPYFEIDSEIYDSSNGIFYCLQGPPMDLSPGRMINEANIEGFLDQWTVNGNLSNGGSILEGFRYLIKGYFRFGSSGAPYLRFDRNTNKFKVNAIQSEACPIQLTINNDRTGNFQYINAIATPLANIIEKINARIS